MAKTVNATLKAKLQLEANNPIYLVELALTGTTLRLAATNGDIVFPTGGNTYTGWGMQFGAIRSQITGDIDRVSVRFDNTNLTFSGYVTSYVFPGRILTIKRIAGDLLGSANYIMTVFAGPMGAPAANESWVEVMAVSPMARLQKQAGRLYQNSCPWEFKGTECAYAGAESTCNKTPGTCKTTMNNIANYGGFIYIPNRVL